MNKKHKIVIDTNVFISALRSNKGASYQLLSMLTEGKFNTYISVPLIFEYEDVAKRNDIVALDDKLVDDIIDYVCFIGFETEIFYLWRPYLSDAKDDFVLELAVNAQVDFIVTYNIKDFKNIDKFGIKVITPQSFLQKIG